jgi:D-3-phosphoglycerate dehydrogenase
MAVNIPNFIFDFDSTIVPFETLDELAKISVQNQPNGGAIIQEIHNLTQQAMDGSLSFHESLKLRLSLLKPTRAHLTALSTLFLQHITPSILRNKKFFQDFSEHIYIVSGGFIEIIHPIAKALGIPLSHCYANRFIYDYEGNIVGLDETNLLAHDQGKANQVKRLKLSNRTIVIGDGFTDYEIKALNAADSFFCFTEIVTREKVTQYADAVIPNLDDLFELCSLPYTPPKITLKKALLLENIHPYAKNILEAQGFIVESIKSSLPEDVLESKLKDISVLGIRSKTKITAAILQQAPLLESIGAFCIGTNQIDLAACKSKAIAVFNAPFSNTRSVVELAMGEIIILLRKIIDANQALHEGNWQKKAENCFEVRGKTLGIIGYGKIGSQLSVLAEAHGMQVCYYDIEEKLPLGNAKPVESLEVLLKQVDVISIHVDGRGENKNLIHSGNIHHIKPGAYLINLARGHVIEINSLAGALKSGQLRGAAVDVFPEEPDENGPNFISALQGLPNVILTPHIGGSTLEAQQNIGEFVASRLKEYAERGSTLHSVNFPQLQLPSMSGYHRVIHIHKNTPGILAQINAIFAQHAVNIEGQYLKTDETIGYVITDVTQDYDGDILTALQNIKHTLKVKILY